MKYIWFFHGANIALVLLVIVSLSVSLLQPSESVDHDTWHQVREQNFHEDEVYSIEEEPSAVKIVHIVTNSPRSVNSQHAINHILASLSRYLVLINDRRVSIQRDYVEDKDETSSKRRQYRELSYVVNNCLENVSQQRDTHEVVEQMDHVPLHTHKIAHYGCQNED